MSGAPPLQILVVDDNPDDRVLVRREAESLFPEAEVREAGSRSEFENAIESGPYDLLVTDLQLRWGSGRDVVRRVQATFPECAIIMFTDSGDEMIAVELMKAGLEDYVVKSARQLPRLRTSMRIAIDHHRNRSALSERERQLAAALAHREVIVRELHHRVKNNFQTITSLLELRAKTKGGALAAELYELAGRMRALAAVQSRIYGSDYPDRVDFASTLTDISTELARAHGDDRTNVIRAFDGQLELEAGRAIPVALLCYEIILNAFKHAWPDHRSGTLTIELRTADSEPEIRVCDDGIGFRQDERPKGFGSRLMRLLAAEARAVVEIHSQPPNGTMATVRLQ